MTNRGKTKTGKKRDIKVLQLNLNNNWGSKNLLEQQMIEFEFAVALISEPPKEKKKPKNWWYSKQGNAAIYCNSSEANKIKLLKTEENYVMMELEGVIMASFYFSPNHNIIKYNEALGELEMDINKYRGKGIVIGGDFNARSTLWGDKCNNRRGIELIEWLEGTDLTLINNGSTPTFIHNVGGESIIDLTLITSGLRNAIRDWKVDIEMESLSDHIPITFTINRQGNNNEITKKSKAAFTRWKIKEIDNDLFTETLEWNIDNNCWKEDGELEEKQKYLNKTLEETMDLVTKRQGINRKNRRNTYWWSNDIAQVRKECIKRRRDWLKAKKKKDNDNTNNKGEKYRQNRKKLRKLISIAKDKAWSELINEINNEPWGLAYKIVMGKLKNNRELIEVVGEKEFVNILEELFPRRDDYKDNDRETTTDWNEEQKITKREMIEAIKKGKNGKAPGIDGIPSIAYKLITETFADRLIDTYNTCMRIGKIPKLWKEARVVLIPKTDWSNHKKGEKISARPICLINEAAKILERVINGRMMDWMKENPESELAEKQFGFKRETSTIDAILELEKIVKPIINKGGVAIAISIDIKNAFNSIPWPIIKKSVRDKGFPVYLSKIIDNYLTDRTIAYENSRGDRKVITMQAGVPQGSVLGPLLWNIAYDNVLRDEMEENCSIFCFADDTLIVSIAKDPRDAKARMEMQACKTLNKIRGMGLEVATQKTSAIMFTGNQKHWKGDNYLSLDGEMIKIEREMKYLGVILDSKLKYTEHDKYIADKAHKIMMALRALMPNLRGPLMKKRKLYANVIYSVLLYAAPLWASEYEKRCRKILQLPPQIKITRMIAQRVISAYRTVSTDVALVLAKLMPLDIAAYKRMWIYNKIKKEKTVGNISNTQEKEIRIKGEKTARAKWEWRIKQKTKEESTMGWTLQGIVDNLNKWLDCKFNYSNYHLTQILTNHGSFYAFLFKNKKKNRENCLICQTKDNAQHVLFSCSLFDTERDNLKMILGENLNNLGELIKKALEIKENWNALAHFANVVMREKENKEREENLIGTQI